MSKSVPVSELKMNAVFNLGNCSLTEDEIISYAKNFDPLPIHTDKKAAKKSIFKGLIASGSHIFHKVHCDEWLPRFGHTVICGLGINNWKFIRPLYPNQLVYTHITIKEIKLNSNKNKASITWFYEFSDNQNKPFQTLEMKVLHNME